MHTTVYPFISSVLTVWLGIIPMALAIDMPEGTIDTMTTAGNKPATLMLGNESGLYTTTDPTGPYMRRTERAISEVVAIPGRAGKLYAVSAAALLASNDEGRTWHEVNIDLPTTDNRIRSLSVTADGRRLVAGTESGYILLSTDDARNWVKLNPDFPLQSLNSIVLHPHEQGVVYAGTGGNGVLKSTDGGTSWVQMNEGLSDTSITRLLMDPDRPERLYAGTYGGGVFVTENGGKSWKQENTGLDNGFIYSMTLLPSRENESTLLVSTWGGVLYGTAAGKRLTWQRYTQ